MVQAQVELIDLLDRILDRGVVVDADIIVSLAGIPLVGLKLRLAVAGVETMIQYGLLASLEERLRALPAPTL